MDDHAHSTTGSAEITRDVAETLGQRIWRRLLEEVRSFAVIALYLWVMFGIFALHEAILAKEHGIDYKFYGFAIINSLVLGKVMLIAEDLRFAESFKGSRSIYKILYKAAAFAALLILFDMLEEIIVGLLKSKSLSESIPHIGGGGFHGIMFVWVILSVALLPYFAFREIDRVLGEQKLRSLIFSKRT